MTFESIYIEFDTKLRKFILGRVSDPEATEDILQNVYLKIHSNIDSLRDSEKLESWIYQIARNAIIDHYRHARERPQTETVKIQRAVPHGHIEGDTPDVYQSAYALLARVFIQGSTAGMYPMRRR